MNVNLKLVHTFLLVAENASFRRAAEIANRSQSAVSMQIRQLELQLGVSLFCRTTRRVQLTREGDLLLVCARRVVDELQSALHQIKEAADIQRGRHVGDGPPHGRRSPRTSEAGVAATARDVGCEPEGVAPIVSWP